MRIFSLDPGLTELLFSLKKGDSLVGISHLCDYPDEIVDLPRVTGDSGDGPVCHQLGSKLLVEQLEQASPDLIVTSFEKEADLLSFTNWINERAGDEVKVLSYYPTRLEQVYETIEALGVACGERDTGFMLAQKLKAQFSSWVDNFYDRIKHKRVLLLTQIEPMIIPGLWVPDMIRLNVSEQVGMKFGEPAREVTWDEIQELKPDVFIFAPEGEATDDNLGLFQYFEKQTGWDDLLAVKRGQVYFSRGGLVFSRPSMRLMSAMAFLISALAGFDSGYITDRDSFQRLRWLEVQRHRFK